MTPAAKRACLRNLALALVFPAVAALSLFLLPAPHKRIHYLVAGTCATAALLAAIGVALWRGRPTTG
ncbi:MAG TPA: hypothetical protein VME43_01300 [Bryobacteraceae bacterium]|nr:hypothetical protein [Bryobacteraceae bacterium]